MQTRIPALPVSDVQFAIPNPMKPSRHIPVLLDDVLPNPRRARALEVRGRAEAHDTGGGGINPRFPNFAGEFLRIRPTRIVSWGLENLDGTVPDEFRVSSRPAG